MLVALTAETRRIGVAAAHGDGAVRETGDFAGFKGDGGGADGRRGWNDT